MTSTSMGSFLDEVALEDSFAARTIAHFINGDESKATDVEVIITTEKDVNDLYEEFEELNRSRS